jgi:hypothetical protein
MVQSNRVTIIPSDGAVYLDLWVYSNLDLSKCGIPEDVHALQWMTDSGHIEYVDTPDDSPKPDHDYITELPDWAIKCIEQWEIAYIANPPIEESTHNESE